MRLPIVPLVIAVTLLAAVWYLSTATESNRPRTLDVPRISRLADIEGVETEVATNAVGTRVAIIANGDLWILNLSTGERKQITRTAEEEFFPNWTTDDMRVTFSRGTDTFAVDPDTDAEVLLRSNATWLAPSAMGRVAFVRDRALWVADTNDEEPRKLVDADMIPDIEVRTPRFSPDGQQIAFIKSQLGIRGEVWIVDVAGGMAQPLVADRLAENPLDVAWINNGTDLAYLTNRAGAYSVWYVHFADWAIYPLTQPLVAVPLARIGMAVSQDRLMLPRHFVDSDIVLSDGTTIANSQKLEFQPAASTDGQRVAYTTVEENKFEIWTAAATGEDPTFHTLGREPRFSANGFEVVYTYTDLNGNDDIWKLDIRNGATERVTDADEIDVTPDWSPDGQSIAFASARGEAISIWTIPASGGKRLRLNEGGYAPRYSPDAKSILFWNRGGLWTMDIQGQNVREVAQNLFEPLAGVWFTSGQGAAFLAKPPVDRLAWPGFDVFKDGRFVFAPVDILDTSLWAIDLTYKED